MNQMASRRDIVKLVTQQLLDEPSQRSLWLQRLAAYILVHNMTDQVDLIVNDIAHELYAQAGIVTVEVVSARKLSAELRSSLQAMLKRQVEGKHKPAGGYSQPVTQIVLHESVDKSILGGFIARTADAEIDASTRTQLGKLKALAQ